MAENINMIPSLQANTATVYDPATVYDKYAVVWYDGDLYQSNDEATGDFDLTKWDRISIADARKNDRYLKAAVKYNDLITYKKGDIVQKRNSDTGVDEFYICLADDTKGNFITEGEGKTFNRYYIVKPSAGGFHAEAIRILDAFTKALGLSYKCTKDSDDKFQYEFTGLKEY